jgi:hypothetical protein
LPSFCTLHSLFCTSLQCPGWESNPQCLEGGRVTAGLADHRTPKAFAGLPRTDTGGSRTHKPQGLSPVAIPVRVPCLRTHHSSFRIQHSTQSPRWESNPRFRHTKTAGFRYNTGAMLTEPPVGIEPTLPRYEGGRLPLQHGGTFRCLHSALHIPHSALPEERLAGVEPAPPTWHADVLPLTPQARSPSEHPAGLEPASPAWEVGMFPLHHGCTRTSGTRRT